MSRLWPQVEDAQDFASDQVEAANERRGALPRAHRACEGSPIVHIVDHEKCTGRIRA